MPEKFGKSAKPFARRIGSDSDYPEVRKPVKRSRDFGRKSDSVSESFGAGQKRRYHARRIIP